MPQEAAGGEGGATSWRRRASGATGVAVLLMAAAWGLLCVRAAGHFRTGLEAERGGRTAEAAREYESAVGFCAPLNPYCSAAAERMRALADRAAKSDPALAEEILDRLTRALRSTRWLIQPHPVLLAAAQSGGAATAPHDPRGWLFLLSCPMLVLGLWAWWFPLRPGPKAALAVTGLGLWALLLYLC